MPVKTPRLDFHRDLDLLASGTISPTQFKEIYSTKQIAFIESDRQYRPNTTDYGFRNSLKTVNRMAQGMKNSWALHGQTKDEIFNN